MMLHREQGIDTLKRVFSAMRNAPAIEAVDQAIPGGGRGNSEPAGAPLQPEADRGAGFPVRESFKAWDGLKS